MHYGFKLIRQSPWSARIGIAMVSITILMAILAPVLAPYKEAEMVGDVWEPPGDTFILGTDHLGRDVYTRLLYGARNTIAVAFITTILSFIIGSSMGFFAANT